MPECVICGEPCKVMLCGAQACKSARKQQLRSGWTKEDRAKDRARYREGFKKVQSVVEVRCPRCLKHHMYRFEWGYVGTPLPYKFCANCAKYADENSEATRYEEASATYRKRAYS